MSTTLQHHGRLIVDGFSSAEFRQGTDCGELVSSAEGTGPDERGGLSRRQQIGLALAILVLLVGSGVAIGGL